MKFREFFCETKDILDIIIDLVEIIERLTFFEYNNKDLLLELFDKSNNLSFKNKNLLLILMIRLGS